MERLPGIPKAMVGISDPPSFELLALSGAMTPRTSPLPKLSRAPGQVWIAWRMRSNPPRKSLVPE